MKALLIDPIAREIRTVTVSGHDGSITRYLNCELFDVVPLCHGEDLFVDDEGRLTYPNPNGYFAIGGAVFCGRGLVVGINAANGESVATKLDPTQLATVVKWLETPAQEEVEPGFTFVALD